MDAKTCENEAKSTEKVAAKVETSKKIVFERLLAES